MKMPGPKPQPVRDRLANSTRRDDRGCWVWQKATDHLGYARIWVGSRSDGTRKFRLAHVVSYEAHIGPVPAGLVLDHLCRTPSCVNPEHLEPVTQNENLGRGRAALAHLVQRTRQPKEGHQMPFGDGSFYFRARDARWVGSFEAGWTATGKRRRIVVTDTDEDAAWAKLQGRVQGERHDAA